jgi:hypothetical protein
VDVSFAPLLGRCPYGEIFYLTIPALVVNVQIINKVKYLALTLKFTVIVEASLSRVGFCRDVVLALDRGAATIYNF